MPLVSDYTEVVHYGPKRTQDANQSAAVEVTPSDKLQPLGSVTKPDVFSHTLETPRHLVQKRKLIRPIPQTALQQGRQSPPGRFYRITLPSQQH